MYVKPEYIPQLEELCSGSQLTFHHVDERPPNSLDMWIANGMFESKGVSFYNQEDIIGFLQNWYNHYGGFCGMPRPLYESRDQMIWDWKHLQDADVNVVPYDVLIINSQPTSGQCLGYSQEEVDALGVELRQNGLYVLFAQWEGVCPYSIRELGKLAAGARVIIGTANGPLWPTFNTMTKDKDRIVFLAPMYLDYGLPGHTLRANTAAEAREHCVSLGLL